MSDFARIVGAVGIKAKIVATRISAPNFFFYITKPRVITSQENKPRIITTQEKKPKIGKVK